MVFFLITIILSTAFVENVLFLFDALSYFIGYMIFIWELRMALIDGYLTKEQVNTMRLFVCNMMNACAMVDENSNTLKKSQ
jgi:hypothetical protein